MAEGYAPIKPSIERTTMTDDHSPAPVKDVVDFYTRWPEIRPRVQAIADGAAPTPDDLEILRWLIRIADMVGPSDLGRTPG